MRQMLTIVVMLFIKKNGQNDARTNYGDLMRVCRLHLAHLGINVVAVR